MNVCERVHLRVCVSVVVLLLGVCVRIFSVSV